MLAPLVAAMGRMLTTVVRVSAMGCYVGALLHTLVRRFYVAQRILKTLPELAHSSVKWGTLTAYRHACSLLIFYLASPVRLRTFQAADGCPAVARGCRGRKPPSICPPRRRASAAPARANRTTLVSYPARATNDATTHWCSAVQD